MSPSDTVLLQEWQVKRDPGAFAEIVSRHAGMVFATCNRILGNRDDAREVAQECFVELMRTTRAVRSSLAAWLHVMAANRALDRVKAEKRRRARELEYAAAQPASDEIKADDLIHMVDEAIAQLPEELGTPLVLRFLEGRTNEEIASAMGIAESTVRYRVDKAVEEVREQLRKRGIAVVGASLLTFLTGQLAEAAPATLVAALGKLAVSGAGAGTVAVGVSLPLLLKIGVIGCAVLAVVAGGWLYVNHGQDDNSTMVTSQTGPAVSAPVLPISAAAVTEDSTDTTRTAPPASDEATGQGAGSAIPEDWQHAAFGRIYDADTGQGIPGVRVQVAPSAGGPAQSSKGPTGPDGHYVVAGLAEGSFTVRPDNIPEYPTTWESLTFSVPRKDRTPLDFALKRGVRVAGRVVDTSGKSVSKARVVGKFEIQANVRRVEETDEEGRFALYLAQFGAGLLLRASTDTATSGVVEQGELPASGLDGVELRLTIPKSCGVEGVVRDASGKPQAGMNIHIQPPSLLGLQEGTSCVSGQDGRFATPSLPPGVYEVIVTPPDVRMFSSAEALDRIELAVGQKLRGLEITYGLPVGLSVSGLVTDTAGKPVAKARVQSYGKEGPKSTYTDDKGGFTLSGLQEGSCSLHAEHRDFGPGFARAQAGATDALIVLKGKARIEGRVIAADTGQPLQAFRAGAINDVRDEYRNDLMSNAREFSDPEGRFVLENVYCMGPSTVAATAPGYAPSWMEVLPVENQTISGIEFRLERVAPIHGVVLGSDGNPVNGAYILLGHYGIDANIEHFAAAKTGADGRFTLESVPPSVATVGAWHSSHAATTATLPPVARRGQEEVTIRLPQAVTATGRVTVNGIPAPETEVFATYPVESMLPSHYVKTGPDGAFTFTGLAPGTVTINSRAKGTDLQLSREVTVEAGASIEVNLDFTIGSSMIFGTAPVIDQRAGLSLRAATPAGNIFVYATPEPDGTYRFEQLPACSGKLLLRLYDNETGAARGEYEYDFAVGEGQALEMNLEM